MSTYLQLCQSLRQECGIDGTGPTSVTGQTKDLARVVDWVKNSWTQIQSRHEAWRWMRSTFIVNTVANDDTYAYGDCTDSRLSATITRFKRWWERDDDGYGNMLCYLTATGVSDQQTLGYLPWSNFRYLYKRGSQTNNRPVHFTIDPQNNIVLGPKPDAVYTITGEYQMSAQTLTDNTDTPEMPADYHMLIVYTAMEKYAGYTSAPEIMSRATLEGNRLMRQLEANQLPRFKMARPLV